MKTILDAAALLAARLGAREHRCERPDAGSPDEFGARRQPVGAQIAQQTPAVGRGVGQQHSNTLGVN